MVYGTNVGGLLASLICSYIERQYGWHYGFGVAGGLGMLLSISKSLYVGKDILSQESKARNEHNIYQRAFLKISCY